MSFEAGTPVPPTIIYTGIPAASTGLPVGVVERLEQLRELTDATHRQMPLAEERMEANTERATAERRLQQLLAHPHDGGYRLHEEDVRVVQQKKLIAELTTTAKRLEDRYQRVSALWQPRARTRSDCETWLKNLPPGTAVAEYGGPAPKQVKGEDTFAAAARLEKRCQDLKANLQKVERAPYPLAHGRARLAEIIESLTQPPDVSALLQRERGEIAWPQVSLRAAVYNAQLPSFAAAETPNALALVAWAMKETLTKQLDVLLAAKADDAGALSVEQRQVQASQILGDLLATERSLAWFAWSGLEQGLPVWFGDISPAAILGAELVTAPAGRSGSSPGHGAIEIVGPR